MRQGKKNGDVTSTFLKSRQEKKMVMSPQLNVLNITSITSVHYYTSVYIFLMNRIIYRYSNTIPNIFINILKIIKSRPDHAKKCAAASPAHIVQRMW